MYELSDQEKKLMEEYEVMMAERRHPDCAIFLERCKTEGIDPLVTDTGRGLIWARFTQPLGV